MAAEQHHDVRGGVGADPGQGEQARGDLVVGQLVRRRQAEHLQVDLAGRHRGREPPQVGAAVAGAHGVAVEGLRRGGHCGRRRERAAVAAGGALAELLDQHGHHADRGRPGTVGGADGLDDVLEHGRAAQHAAGALGDPGQALVLGRHAVEAAQVLVQVEHDVHGRAQLVGGRGRRRRAEHLHPRRAAAVLRDHDRARLCTAERQRGPQRPGRLVQLCRRQRGDAVRDEGAPQVDRLAVRPSQRQDERHRHLQPPSRLPVAKRRPGRRGLPTRQHGDSPSHPGQAGSGRPIHRGLPLGSAWSPWLGLRPCSRAPGPLRVARAVHVWARWTHERADA